MQKIVYRGLLMMFNIIAVIWLLWAIYIAYYVDTSILNIMFLIILTLEAFGGFVLFFNETVPFAIVYACLTALLAIAAFADIFNEGIHNGKKKVEDRWEDEKETPGSMSDLESEYKCCGKDSSHDYQNLLHRRVPSSCYDNNRDGAAPYKEGCITAVPNSYLLLAGLICSFLFTLLWLAFAIVLIIRFKKRDSDANNK